MKRLLSRGPCAALLIGALISCWSAPLSASDIDTKMKVVVTQFAQITQDKITDPAQLTMALFPFQTDEKLAKKRVNLAVVEILTHHLIQDGTFRLVERNELQRILDEQKLGQTGAVESETAARVGQILGARFVALGNVMRIGQSYQISAKLVDTHTSEIVTAAIQEVPVKTFDEEAARYLVLVPEHQAIGLYCQAGFPFFIQTTTLAATTLDDFDNLTITPSNRAPSPVPPSSIGIGVRYFPWSRWMFDLQIFFHMDFEADGVLFSLTRNGTPVALTNYFPTMIVSTGIGGELSFNRVVRVFRRLNVYAGLGIDVFELGYVEDNNDQFWINDTSYGIEVGENRNIHYLPLVRLGMGWRVQARFGLALFGNVYLMRDKDHIEATLILNPGEPIDTKTLTVYELHLPMLQVGLSVAFYF